TGATIRTAPAAQAGGGGDTAQPVGLAGDYGQPTAQPAPEVQPGSGDYRFDKAEPGRDFSVPAANPGVDAAFADNCWLEDARFAQKRLRGLADHAGGAAEGLAGMSLALLLGGFGWTYRNDTEDRSRRLMR